MISPGEKLATDFRLKVVECGVVKEMVFKELLTQRTVVSIYMRNNTGSCDRQNDSLQAHASEIASAGYRVVALSRDPPGSHLKFAAKNTISHVLASDPTDLFARSADAIVEKSMYGRTFFGPARAALVLETDGTVLAVMEKIDPRRHAEQVLATIAALK